MNKDFELIDELLRKTARSFYLTLYALPKAIRKPVSVAYLLARATDTIADVGQLSMDKREFFLDKMIDMIHSGPDVKKMQALNACLSAFSPHSAEYELLSHFDDCVKAIYSSDEKTCTEIKTVLNTIVEGQRLDIKRFQSSNEMACLQTMKELDDYTYLVAGCVGEFWTKMCNHYISNYSQLDEKQLFACAISFGKGLQLVNILRDVPQDLAQGRCYLPKEQLQQYHLSLEDITKQTETLKPLVAFWWKQAVTDLQDGWRYMLSINHRRIRGALALPLLLGFATLELLEDGAYLDCPQPTKVSRGRVRLLMVIAFLGMISKKCFSLVHLMTFSRLLPKAHL
jgi:farnesyl-diphosphate farnesyltransferase